MTLALAAVLLSLVNHQRVEHGERPLSSSAPLTVTAGTCPERGVRVCAAREGFSAGVIGVDTAWGQRWPSAVIAAWLRSPAHRGILLDPRFRSAGAVVRGRWWRVVFARASASVPARGINRGAGPALSGFFTAQAQSPRL